MDKAKGGLLDYVLGLTSQGTFLDALDREGESCAPFRVQQLPSDSE